MPALGKEQQGHGAEKATHPELSMGGSCALVRGGQHRRCQWCDELNAPRRPAALTAGTPPSTRARTGAGRGRCPPRGVDGLRMRRGGRTAEVKDARTANMRSDGSRLQPDPAVFNDNAIVNTLNGWLFFRWAGGPTGGPGCARLHRAWQHNL